MVGPCPGAVILPLQALPCSCRCLPLVSQSRWRGPTGPQSSGFLGQKRHHSRWDTNHQRWEIGIGVANGFALLRGRFGTDSVLGLCARAVQEVPPWPATAAGWFSATGRAKCCWTCPQKTGAARPLCRECRREPCRLEGTGGLLGPVARISPPSLARYPPWALGQGKFWGGGVCVID